MRKSHAYFISSLIYIFEQFSLFNLIGNEMLITLYTDAIVPNYFQNKNLKIQWLHFISNETVWRIFMKISAERQ
jgi:hypothetical protein